MGGGGAGGGGGGGAGAKPGVFLPARVPFIAGQQFSKSMADGAPVVFAVASPPRISLAATSRPKSLAASGGAAASKGERGVSTPALTPTHTAPGPAASPPTPIPAEVRHVIEHRIRVVLALLSQQGQGATTTTTSTYVPVGEVERAIAQRYGRTVGDVAGAGGGGRGLGVLHFVGDMADVLAMDGKCALKPKARDRAMDLLRDEDKGHHGSGGGSAQAF